MEAQNLCRKVWTKKIVKSNEDLHLRLQALFYPKIERYAV